MFRVILAGLFALALPVAAFATATVQSVSGRVEAGATVVKPGVRIFPGTSINTDAGAQVFLRFDDGMQIVVHENSHLRFLDYRYTPTRGSSDRAVFELLRGAARVVTGKVAQHNPSQFFFRTPQTELQIEEPSDFTVALVNPAYITVHAGRLTSTNGFGPAQLVRGSTSAIASNAAAPVAIPASALPPSAAAATTKLAAVSVTPVAGGAAPVAGGAASGVAGAGTAGAGIAIPAVAVGAAAFGLAVAAVASKNKSAVNHAPTQ